MYLQLSDTPTTREEKLCLTAASLPLLDHWQARVGGILTVVDPQGRCHRARLLDPAGRVQLFQTMPQGVEPAACRRLCQAWPDKERMTWIIQKAVELGATAIQPMITDHCAWHAKPGGGHPSQDKSATWQKISREAARQCRRALLPPVFPVMPLEALLSTLSGETVLWLDITADATPLHHHLPRLARQSLALLVGSEGGFSDRERQLLRQAGGLPVSLGARILRTETAAMAAMALLATGDGPILSP